MSGDFVFTVYGLILHAEEYFSINKNMNHYVYKRIRLLQDKNSRL